MSLVAASRQDLEQPQLRWYISQQPPTDDPAVNDIDVTAALEQTFATDDRILHIKAFALPPQEKQLVLNTEGVIALGEALARGYLAPE